MSVGACNIFTHIILGPPRKEFLATSSVLSEISLEVGFPGGRLGLSDLWRRALPYFLKRVLLYVSPGVGKMCLVRASVVGQGTAYEAKRTACRSLKKAFVKRQARYEEIRPNLGLSWVNDLFGSLRRGRGCLSHRGLRVSVPGARRTQAWPKFLKGRHNIWHLISAKNQ